VNIKQMDKFCFKISMCKSIYATRYSWIIHI